VGLSAQPFELLEHVHAMAKPGQRCCRHHATHAGAHNYDVIMRHDVRPRGVADGERIMAQPQPDLTMINM
jgi:hypothetical protein